MRYHADPKSISAKEQKTMRSYEGQLSDNRPIKRSREEKQRQLAELEQQRAALKQHTSPVLRQAIDKRITELREELSRAPEPRRERRDQEGDRRPPRPRRESGGSTPGR